mmetsp:Transcript_17253/g.34601  ORF Transcript_17253/g.34601 Transcript_17253/m.34601 type:complete len:120 (+) Transcript_17253:908-1267(+)
MREDMLSGSNKYPFTAAFVAVNCDEDPEEWRRSSRERWKSMTFHAWADSSVIKLLKIRYVPNRLIVDCRSRKILMWWDGEFGRVLHGPWASSVKNPSKGILWECQKYVSQAKRPGGRRR